MGSERRRRREEHVDPEYWERLLEREGMPAEPQKRRMRETVAGEDGRRRWRGPYEQPMPHIGGGTYYNGDNLLRDPADTIGSNIDNSGMPETELQALMETAPHDPIPDSLEGRAARTEGLETAILQAIAQLTDRQATIAILRLVNQMTFEQIAEEIGGSREGTRLSWLRIREQLADTLDNHPTVEAHLND